MSEQNPSEEPTRQTLGQVKVDIYQWLGKGWKELVSYFQIPPHEEARFDHGGECRDIWAWLESRRRLDELPGSVTFQLMSRLPMRTPTANRGLNPPITLSCRRVELEKPIVCLLNRVRRALTVRGFRSRRSG